MAAFLDIVHGLYGLAWKDPVEDPRFLDEYQAYYRSREDWNQVIYPPYLLVLTLLYSIY